MSDHFSGPAVMGDPAVDITDFYAFPSPERPGNLVLIMDVFPMATSQSFFSNVLTHRFRLRPLTRSSGGVTYGTAEHTIDVTFSDVTEGGTVQKAQHRHIRLGAKRASSAAKPFEDDGMRVFAGLVSDPFFMDVEAALRTDMTGKLSFDTAVKQFSFATSYRSSSRYHLLQSFEQFNGATLIGAISENIVTRRGKPIRLERLGRPEVKNVLMANPTRDHAPRASSFAIFTIAKTCLRSPPRTDHSTSRVSMRTSPSSTRSTARPRGRSGPDGRHPLRDLFINDYLIVDLARAFAPASFLEIERALIGKRPHKSAGGRWLDDDILDELLTLMVNGGQSERLGDGVDSSHQTGQFVVPLCSRT